jgi:RimJ/RimL family protein N-acetyltransferase
LHPEQLDIGAWLGVPYWGKGLMTDAVRLMTYFSFQHLNAVRVYATVFVGNTPSRRMLERNGFVLDGTLRCQALKRGKWLDEWFFTLLRPEWESHQDWYQPRHENLAAG